MTSHTDSEARALFPETLRPAGLLLLAALAALLAAGRLARASEEPAQTQTECPVMVGNKIDPNLFVTYEGKKVYFCCKSCRKAFGENPEKYLSRLPQFASAGGESPSTEHDEHQHAEGSSWKPAAAKLIEPLGLTTLSLVAATVALGVFRRRKPRLLLRIHKICGALALAAGACHATLVWLVH